MAENKVEETAGLIDLKKFKRFGKTATLEEVLCLGTLVATGSLPPEATTADASKHFESVGEYCNYCPLHDKCLAYLLWE